MKLRLFSKEKSELENTYLLHALSLLVIIFFSLIIATIMFLFIHASSCSSFDIGLQDLQDVSCYYQGKVGILPFGFFVVFDERGKRIINDRNIHTYNAINIFTFILLILMALILVFEIYIDIRHISKDWKNKYICIKKFISIGVNVCIISCIHYFSFTYIVVCFLALIIELMMQYIVYLHSQRKLKQ